MKTIGIVAVFVVVMQLPARSQEKAPGLPEVENLQDFYRTGIGVRVGWPVAALTIKHFIQKRTALEFIVAPQFGGATLTILAERHHATRRPGWYWYYGVGADVGAYRGESFSEYDGDHYPDDRLISAAINAVMGMEINIHETPFSIGFDIKPRIGFYNPGGAYLEGAVTFKYIWSR